MKASITLNRTKAELKRRASLRKSEGLEISQSNQSGIETTKFEFPYPGSDFSQSNQSGIETRLRPGITKERTRSQSNQSGIETLKYSTP